jgi:hypothetical protein
MTTTPLRMRALLAGTMAVLTGALLFSMVPGVAVAQQPPQEWDGLVRAKNKALDNVYVRPNVEFKAYKRVRLDPIQVAMDKNWDPNSGKVGLHGGLSSADVQRIREDLSKLFRDVFAERLSKDGYPLVETTGDDVLLVQAALINVYITAPDAGSTTTRSYVMDAGRMTLVMQLADSVTGQLLGRAVDTKQGTDTRRLQWANSVTNSVEARKAIGQWADALCKALDTVNGRTAGK